MRVTEDQARLIFFAALEKGPDLWPAYLDEACANDAALRSRVNELLEAHQALGTIHGGQAATASFESTIAEQPGMTIGSFKLLQQIGEGGMGVVFLAKQQSPVRRNVALKVVKPGMDSRQVLARFEAERQALAIMDHPNIAKVFDAGATESGRPYFVMELIKGEPITEFCDRNHLAPRERLDLFTQVCNAVQHAHQKGVIHRDVKPTNVLVEMHDSIPVVKVIDFGVAKALGQELTDKTLFTGFGQLLGTPLYMSPEQAGYSALDIDTRSDIYSLGVLLYELLTGSTPFNKERFVKAAQDEIWRIIREEDPPKPSTRLSESKDSLASISAQRHTEPAKLTKLVRGDLDWIVMKAMEKERGRRYETASGLARDIERFLHDEAVEACPPSAIYRMKKFGRRNKGPVLAAGMVLLTLIAGIAGTSFGLVRAERARRTLIRQAESERLARQEAESRETEKNAVLEFVENRILAAARPVGIEGGLGNDVTLRQAIEAALPFVKSGFANQPLIEARLRMTLGASFYYLGDAKPAAAQFERAGELFTNVLGADHSDTLASRQNLAECYAAIGRDPEALQLYEDTAKRQTKPDFDHPKLLSSTYNLATAYASLGRHAESLRLFKENLSRREARLGRHHWGTVEGMDHLADSHESLGQHAEAMKLREETLARRRARFVPEHSEVLTNLNKLANSYAAVGRYADNLKLREELLKLRQVKLGPEHPDTIASMYRLAVAQALTGRVDEACRMIDKIVERGFFTQALASATKIGHDAVNQLISGAVRYPGERTPQPLDALVLGELRLIAGEQAPAEAAIRAAIQRDGAKPYFYKSLGLCLFASGKSDEGRKACERVLSDCPRKQDGAYDLGAADPDQMTAAYFLDLISEEQYIEHFAADERLASFPWFYAAQRREIEGHEDAAITAYERCVELGDRDDPHALPALAKWRLHYLEQQRAKPRRR